MKRTATCAMYFLLVG